MKNYTLGDFIVSLEDDASEVSVAFESVCNTQVWFTPPVIHNGSISLLHAREGEVVWRVKGKHDLFDVSAYLTDEGITIEVVNLYEEHGYVDSTYFFPSDFDIEVDYE